MKFDWESKVTGCGESRQIVPMIYANISNKYFLCKS